MRLKMERKRILSLIFIISLINGSTFADKVTMERIRKHQEWLKQRNQGRHNLLSTAKPNKSIELLNLWRFSKKENNSANEVYPENDNILTTEATSTTITPHRTTTSTTAPQLTTTRTTLPTTTALQTTTHLIASVTPSDNTVLQKDLNFHSELSTTNDWLSNDILETTTPFITTTTRPPPFTTTTQTTTTTRKQKPRPYPRWGNWGTWSICSRSCGGGIKHQLRKCINRNSLTGKLHLSKNCIGVYKRYQLCNEQPCPSQQQDFRALQCSSYNNVDFQGQQFVWEPYIKDDAECELNCKPLGMKYFATLNASVIDGTACGKPAEYYRTNYRGRAMCIDGICKGIVNKRLTSIVG